MRLSALASAVWNNHAFDVYVSPDRYLYGRSAKPASLFNNYWILIRLQDGTLSYDLSHPFRSRYSRSVGDERRPNARQYYVLVQPQQWNDYGRCGYNHWKEPRSYAHRTSSDSWAAYSPTSACELQGSRFLARQRGIQLLPDCTLHYTMTFYQLIYMQKR